MSKSSPVSRMVQLVAIVAIIITTFTTFVHNENEIVGLDRNNVKFFSAKERTFVVMNVDHNKHDDSLPATLKFSINGSKVEKMKSVFHQNTTDEWVITLNDETDLSVAAIKLKLNDTTMRKEHTIHAMKVNWPGRRELQDEKRELCFHLGKNVTWFNTYQQYHQQWPMNLTRRLEKVPFNALQEEPTSELQHLVEGTFLASNGFILRLSGHSPLWYRIVPESRKDAQEGQMCITSWAAAPYNTAKANDDTYHDISFTLFTGADLKETYKTMVNFEYLGGILRPHKVPQWHMFAYPIWEISPGRSDEFPDTASLSTEKIKVFAMTLKRHKMLHSTFLFDAWWQRENEYLQIDTTQKLRDLKYLAELLSSNDKKSDYKIQLAVSPYVSKQSSFFKQHSSMLVQDALQSGSPFVIRNGANAGHGLLDFSNSKAATWFLDRLRAFQNHSKVAGFVFDPVTLTEVHVKFAGLDVKDVPALYSNHYASLAGQLLDSSITGVKEARGNQDLSLFVHMSPRVSDWNDPRGIKSLIPTALALSMAGYSFIVPDLVGGRLPGPDGSLIPDGELYTRWAQVTAFMPAMQFATPPWYYRNDTITDAVLHAIRLHTDTFMELTSSMANQRVYGDGSPIMRPMWWADPADPKLYEAGIVDTQFLLGEPGTSKEQLLVAPILERGATDRLVYLPVQGSRWIQQENGVDSNTFWEGGQSHRVSATLQHLLYFKKAI